MESDNRIYRLTDKKEIDAFVEQYGSKEHLLSAFIKCACLFMLENNTIKEFWEFDDHYLHIRHIKEDPEKEINYSAIQRWYGKK